jgi:hypothetical protein
MSDLKNTEDSLKNIQEEICRVTNLLRETFGVDVTERKPGVQSQDSFLDLEDNN